MKQIYEWRGNLETNSKKIIQSILAVLFIVLTIGSGHLVMISIEHFDEQISEQEYKIPGEKARWKGSVSEKSALQKMLSINKYSGDVKSAEIVQAAIHEFREKGTVSFNMLPVSAFLCFCTLLTALAGVIILLLSRYVKTDGAQTTAGIFAGLMFWFTVENGLIIASRHLGIARRFDIINGNLIGIRGEYVLLEYSWMFMVLIFFYLLFQEGVRCNFFVFFRRRLHLMRGGTFSGRIDNYAPRVAFFYTSSIWFFYVLLLIAFDEKILGPNTWFTYAIFLVCFASTGYLFYKLIHQGSTGAILRYSIGVALVLWTDIEILGKWGKMKGPWLDYNPAVLTVFIVGLIAGAFLVRREVRNRS